MKNANSIQIIECYDHVLLAGLNEEVQSLHHNLYPEVFKPYNREEITKFFLSALPDINTKVFVAVESDKPIAFILLMVKNINENPYMHERRFVLIDQIAVLNSHRGNGVGKLLLEKAFTFAGSSGIKRVELNHWTLNESAGKFFKKNGFSYFNEKMCIEL